MFELPLFLLKPSLIPDAGVGCFSLSAIARGERLGREPSAFRYLAQDEIPDAFLKFCILLESGRFLSPENFLRMGVFWYINHAKVPNVAFDGKRLTAVRGIRPGEELTLYYSDLLTHPKNKLWVRPSDV